MKFQYSFFRSSVSCFCSSVFRRVVRRLSCLPAVRFAAALPLLFCLNVQAAGTLLDQFESSALTGWSAKFSSSLGTSGAIVPVTGPDGSGGLGLDYSFRCTAAGSTCNEYVAAAISLSPQPAPLSGLSFVTRSSPEVNLFVRVVDASGQTIQFRVRRPVTGFDPAAWYEAVVDFADPMNYWDGAANGVIQGQIRAIWILASSTSGRAATGRISIDDLVHLSALPAPWQPTYQNGLASIDSFDSRSITDPWQFSRSGVAGVSGELSLAAGKGSVRALSLDYQFSCATAGSACGQYVMALLNLQEFLPAGPGGLRFMVRSSPEVAIALRVTDESGQVLQYAVARPVESFNPAYWAEANILLTQPTSYWGGAANGVIQGRIKSLSFVVEPRAGRAISGSVLIDSIAMRATVPAEQATAYVNGQYVLDAFDTRTFVDPWSVSASSAGGGAGGLAPVTGYNSERALGLPFSLTCATVGSTCGQYVMARLPLEVAVSPGGGMSLWTRSPADVQLTLRVIDSGGQTFQYRLARPLDGNDGVTWYLASVDLAKPKDYWGGANNGVIQGRIKEVALVAESTAGRAVSGTVSIDAVTLLQNKPAAVTLDYVDGRAVLDDLELAGVPGWAAYGPSVAGVSVSVSPTAGHAGSQALALNYSFNCTTVGSNCGQYAAATFSLPYALMPGAGIAFTTRSSPELKLLARVVDESGQTLQYRVPRPLEGFDPAAWHQVAFELAKPTSYWGGANNGVIQGRISAIWIIAESKVGRAVSGTVAIDNLVMLSVMPPAHVLTYTDGRALLDAFDNRSVTEPWEFAKSSASGSSGSLTTATGYTTTRGLGLKYGFTCTTAGSTCGQYVMARVPLEVPVLPGKGLSLATRSPADVQLTLRVIDSGGQTLQYRLVRPLKGYDGVTWYVASIDLAKPKDYWGGANNGVIQGRVKEIALVAESRAGRAISGTVSVDAVTMLKDVPAPVSLGYADGRATLDDLERPTLGPWGIYKPSVAGMSASVSAVAGYASTQALALNYSFNCTSVGSNCGQYAAATFSLPYAVTPGVGIAFMTRSSPELKLFARVIDESGQTLQYRVPRPLEGFDPAAWHQVAFALNRPSSYWGGANNGVVQGRIRSIWIVAESRVGRAVSGAVAIDDLAMLSVMPPAHLLTYIDGRAPLDAFDNRSVTEPWEFAKSSAPGSSGSLTTATGYTTTRGLGLKYGFTCTTAGSTCGQYVMARLPLEVPILPDKGLSLATRSPADILLTLRVIDSGGQTLQYRLARPLEGYDGVTWYVASVDLAKPKDYWGGANNGVIQGRVKEIALVAESMAGRAFSGTVSIDAVTMLEQPPSPAVTSLDQGMLSLDDFDNRTTVSPWVIETGNTLVTTSLSMETGYASTRSLALNYQFRCSASGQCADFASARLSFSAPLESGGTITVRVKHPGNVRAKLRVRDETGQILQYPLTRPIEVKNVDDWFLARADLQVPESHWGGAGSGVPEGRITAVWVMAVNSLNFADQGKLLVDELRMYREIDTQFVLTPTAPLVSPPATGATLNGRVGINIRNHADLSALDAAAEAGVGYVRVDLLWESVERNGVLDFSSHENAFAEAEARGMGALFILDYGHPDYDVLVPSGRAAFARFAEAAARKFAGKNVRFEVWNEPDHPGFWPGSPDANSYMALFREAVLGLHRGDPGVVVTTGGLASFNYDYLDGMLLAGVGNTDAIGLHAYRSTDPETLVESLAIANWLVNRRIQKTLPIWITEAGYSNVQIPGSASDEAFLRTQAMLLSRQALTYWALDVPVGVWFSLTDRGEDELERDHNFGLLRMDYTRKPAFYAMRTFHELLSSTTFSGFVRNTPAGLHLMQFESADERIFVVWHEPVVGSTSLSVPSDAFIDAVDFLGNSVFSDSSGGGNMTFRLEESNGPTYLRFRK